jgi:hypothetical protein
VAVGIGTIGGGILVEHVVQGQVCSVVVGTGSLANGRGRAWWIVFICQGSSCLHNEKIDIKSVAVYIDLSVLISRRNRSYAFPGAGKCVPRLESRANNLKRFRTSWSTICYSTLVLIVCNPTGKRNYKDNHVWLKIRTQFARPISGLCLP